MTSIINSVHVSEGSFCDLFASAGRFVATVDVRGVCHGMWHVRIMNDAGVLTAQGSTGCEKFIKTGVVTLPTAVTCVTCLAWSIAWAARPPELGGE